MKHKATDEQLKAIVAESISFSESMRKCDMKPRGASYQWFQRRIKKLGIDTSHFKGYSAGGIVRAKQTKKNWKQILVIGDGSGREKTTVLRKAFAEFCSENDIEYICNSCQMKPSWCGKPLKLQVDHINEVNYDNTPENLQWLCGNCHSQKNDLQLTKTE